MRDVIATVVVWILVFAGFLAGIAAIALVWERTERRWRNRRR